VDFTAQIYPGVGHAFFNDTNPRAYDAPSAEDAWQRALAFFAAHLGG
jgi:carboxymethylenebutenolidase